MFQGGLIYVNFYTRHINYGAFSKLIVPFVSLL